MPGEGRLPKRSSARKKKGRGASRRRKQTNRLPIISGAIGGTIIVAVIGVVAWLVSRPDVVESLAATIGETTSRMTGAVSNARSWPPSPDMPRDEIFADHGDEPIVPASDETGFNPLRRRYVDPWVVLSNPRLETDPLNRRMLVVDYEVVEDPASQKDGSFTVYSYANIGGGLGGGSPHFLYRKDHPTRQPRQISVYLGNSEIQGAEVFLVVYDTDYTISLIGKRPPRLFAADMGAIQGFEFVTLHLSGVMQGGSGGRFPVFR